MLGKVGGSINYVASRISSLQKRRERVGHSILTLRQFSLNFLRFTFQFLAGVLGELFSARSRKMVESRPGIGFNDVDVARGEIGSQERRETRSRSRG